MVTFNIPPSNETLRKLALNHYRANLRKEYLEMKRDGSLEEALTLKVTEARRYAENLIESGTFEDQAWHWAWRVKICGAEPD
jgi:hypothetical protein